LRHFHDAYGRQSAEPSWLSAFAQQSFSRFQEIGFPSVDEEEWKYTNVARFARVNSPGHACEWRGDRQTGPGAWTIRRSAGRLYSSTEFSSGPSSSLAMPQAAYGARLWKSGRRRSGLRLSIRASIRASRRNDNGFVALDNALFAGGLFLQIERKRRA
jgi:hypothetical protein